MPLAEWGYPDFPEAMTEVWEHYKALSHTRQVGMAINPITYLEIQAYENVMTCKLSMFEVQAIKKLDAIALSFEG